MGSITNYGEGVCVWGGGGGGKGGGGYKTGRDGGKSSFTSLQNECWKGLNHLKEVGGGGVLNMFLGNVNTGA